MSKCAGPTKFCENTQKAHLIMLSDKSHFDKTNLL